jgi:hypothetical protein
MVRDTSGRDITGFAALIDVAPNYQAPINGFSITLAKNDSHVILVPAGTLATGTITMPAAPYDGQIIDIRTSKEITTLTIAPNAGQSVLGNPATLAAGGRTEAIYKLANTTWYFGS